jgi:hypothetical protein
VLCVRVVDTSAAALVRSTNPGKLATSCQQQIIESRPTAWINRVTRFVTIFVTFFVNCFVTYFVNCFVTTPCTTSWCTTATCTSWTLRTQRVNAIGAVNLGSLPGGLPAVSRRLDVFKHVCTVPWVRTVLPERIRRLDVFKRVCTVHKVRTVSPARSRRLDTLSTY